MHLQLEPGSDIAAAVLLDPTLHPEGVPWEPYDAQEAELERLVDEASLLWMETEGDGTYLLDVWIDEPVPDRLIAAGRRSAVRGHLRIPSGQLVACGLEDLLIRSRHGKERTFQTGQRRTLPPGTYDVEAWFCSFEETAADQAIADAIGEDAFRRREAAGNAGCSAAILVAAAVACWYNAWPWLAAGATGLAAVSALRARLNHVAWATQENKALAEAAQRRFPTVVIHLERNEDEAAGHGVHLTVPYQAGEVSVP